jgi:hypothetical protein
VRERERERERERPAGGADAGYTASTGEVGLGEGGVQSLREAPRRAEEGKYHLMTLRKLDSIQRVN